MNDPRAADTAPLNPPDVSTGTKRRQLEGEEAPDDQDAALSIAEVETSEPLTDTEIDEGELEAGASAFAGEGQMSIESLASLEFRSGETGNPDVAAEEGEVWVPPIDPPVVPDASASGGVSVAAGFATSAMDEPFDTDHHDELLPTDDEVSARVREALVADSRTSRLADRVGIDTEGGVVILRGTVDDLDDSDLLAAVASGVDGVADVRDETDVEGL